MPTYRFTARDQQDRHVSGHVDAPNLEAAKAQLARQGLQLVEIIEAESGPHEPARPQPLAREEANQLLENLAQLSGAGLPLPSGLRAAADESENPRLAAALLYLADQLDQGRSLEDVVASSDLPLPRYASRLIETAARSGQLGPALMEIVEHYRMIDGLKRDIWHVLAYPILVLVLAAVIFVLVPTISAPGFERIFHDFGVKLPVMTILFLAWSHLAPWLVPSLAIFLLVLTALVHWQLSPLARRRWFVSMPVLGPLWHWLGLLEWLGLVRAMVRNQVPLFDALRLSADAASDPNVAHISRNLSEAVARGRSLWQSMANQRAIPSSLVPVVRWGEEAGILAESLDISSDMLQERVRGLGRWIQMALPPVLLVAIGCCAVWVVASAFLPLIALMHNLTGGG